MKNGSFLVSNSLKMELTVTLVRHGNTDANNERWLQGQVDTDLNMNGLQQAKLCGERLATDKFDHIYCSDLTRCKKTASAIMDHHQDLTIQYEPSLRERDFGTLSRQPIKFLGSESKRLNISVHQLISSHNGESEEGFKVRVVNAFETLIEDAQEKKYQSILVLTHGGPLRALTNYWLETGYQSAEDVIVASVAQGNTAITKITIHDKRIIEFNSVSHLKNTNYQQPPPPAV